MLSPSLFIHSTPRASKVHCSINGLENSSSPEYSKVQHLFGIAVGLFLVGGGLFSVTGGLGKSPPPTKKSPPPIGKSPTLTQKSPTLTKKVQLEKKSSSNNKKVLLQWEKVPLPILEISPEVANNKSSDDFVYIRLCFTGLWNLLKPRLVWKAPNKFTPCRQ